MIPDLVERHLRERYHGFEHHVHRSASTAQELASAERLSGHRVAKVVVLDIGGELAMAVVAATDRVNLAPLEEATGTEAALAPEATFAPRFSPCEVGAEPPLAIFGVPIFVDDKLLREQRIAMPAGTHEDAVLVDTHEWLWQEHAQPIVNLGRRSPRDLS
jgi:Ala-tRNA(Pro) deacylase